MTKNMEDKYSIIARRILYSAFYLFYAIVLAVNVIQSAHGTAELARHHFIPFCLISYAYFVSVPAAAWKRCRMLARAFYCASIRLAERVARTIRATVKSLRQLPRSFRQNYRAFLAESK